MEFYQNLPRNKKEFCLFLAVISIISVNIIAPLITCFEVGFSLVTWGNVLRILPFIWLCVVSVVLITYQPAEWLTNKISPEGDSCSAHITINILCSVLIMSPILTVVCTWIGTRSISLEPIAHFFYKWPRNFAVSFGIEALIAQPIARAVMRAFHKRIDSKSRV